MASKQPAVRLSSASADFISQTLKSPGNSWISGTFLLVYNAK